MFSGRKDKPVNGLELHSYNFKTHDNTLEKLINPKIEPKRNTDSNTIFKSGVTDH